jgi:hypothetical protein
MNADLRLHFLEMFDGLTDTYVTPETLALVQPMTDGEYALVEEADKLVAPNDKLASAKWDLLTSERVFGSFVSLQSAIRHREAQWNTMRAPVSAVSSEPEQPQAVRYGQDTPDRFMQKPAAPVRSAGFNLHTGQ